MTRAIEKELNVTKKPASMRNCNTQMDIQKELSRKQFSS